MIAALVIAWAAWALVHVAVWLGVQAAGVMLGGRAVASSRYPAAFAVGPAVVITTGLRAMLTRAELEAVIAHERGHIARRHSLQRLALAVLLPGIPLGWLARRHELEADAYAARRAGASALASALRKLPHPKKSRSHPSLAERLTAIGADSLR